MKKHVQHVGSRLQETISMDKAWYITGFVDGEGCFSVSFNKRAKLKTKLEVRPSFSLGQSKQSLSVLQDIKNYFGCGAIRFSKNDQTYKYEVRSISDLRKRIIPHFEKYPLQTAKQQDFQIFSNICNQIAASKHLNVDFLALIIDQAYIMNKSGKQKYTRQELLKIIVAR